MSNEDSPAPFRRLVEIIARLRGVGGCPWDRDQTPESLKPYLLEEAYEVLEALDKGEAPAIRDELGDLLLQIVLQARIFEERGHFSIDDVATTIVEKLVRRHPHVFAATADLDPAGLDAQWERIKAQERTSLPKVPGETAENLDRHLPALMRARKVAEKAARTGHPVAAGIEATSLVQKKLRDLGERPLLPEFGELLLAVVELGRTLRIDAEEALRLATERFLRSHPELGKSADS